MTLDEQQLILLVMCDSADNNGIHTIVQSNGTILTDYTPFNVYFSQHEFDKECRVYALGLQQIIDKFLANKQEAIQTCINNQKSFAAISSILWLIFIIIWLVIMSKLY